MKRLVFTALIVAGCDPDPPPPPPPSSIIETVAGTNEAAYNGEGKPALETSLYAPIKVSFDAQGLPLIADWNNHRVRTILGNGRMITVLGNGMEEGGDANSLAIGFAIHHPLDFEITPNGELFFAGYHDPRVLKVDLSQRVRVVAGLGVNGDYGDGGPATLAWLNAPSGVAVADDGTVWITDELNHNIRRVDRDGMIHRFAGTSTRGYSGDGGPAIDAELDAPTRIELDRASGAIYFCDTGNDVVRRIDPDGTIHTVAGTGEEGFGGDGGPATDALLYRPIDLVLLDDGSFLIADSENHRIRRVDRDGIITTIAGTGEPGYSGDGGAPIAAAFDTPWGITADAAGRLWIADTANHVVRRAGAELLSGAKPR